MFKYIETPAFNENTSHGLLTHRINKGEKILEFGCARGDFSAYVKENLGCSVVGVEISKEALDVARGHLDKAILADIEKYEWENELCGEKFDVVMFADVLEHLKDPVRVLKVASGYLKHGGRILFSLPNIAHTDIIAKLLNNRFDYTRVGLLDSTHIRFWAKENIKELCENAGLFLHEMAATYAIPGSTEQSGYTDDSIQKFISNYNRHDIYQFVCVAYLADYAEQNSLCFIDNVLPSPKKSTRVYYDRGEGFTDGDMTVIYESIPGIVSFSVNDIKDAIRIRIDFRESKGFIVKNFFFGFDGKEASPISVVGAMRSDNSYAIVEDDSQFVFDVPSGTENFNVSAEIIMLFNSEFLSSYIGRLISREQNFLDDLSNAEKEINEKNLKLKKTNDILDDTRKKLEDTTTTMENMQSELKQVESELQQAKSELAKTEEKLNSVELQLKSAESELDHYKTHYFAAINQRTELRAEVAHLKAQYDCISNSQFWKITKPFRVFLDIIKKIIKKIPPLYLFAKSIKCLKQNGFKYTWEKIRNYNKYRHDYSAALAPLYTDKELSQQKKYRFERDIKISILVPLYNTPEKFLHEMIRSVLDQTYRNFELCLADGSDDKHDIVEKICKKYAKKDKRVVYKKLEKNLGISDNTNACIDMATGDYIALFDHDDLLHPAALYEVMTQICDKNADFVYTDEATFESPDVTKIITIHHKPDYAVDNLRANNYICHLSVFSRVTLEKAGNFRHEYDGSQDHDMILRLTENSETIVHIPKVLYFWRSHPMSVAMDINSKTYAIDAGRRAVRDSIMRAGYKAIVESSRAFPTIYKIKYELKSTPKVSIIIPNKNHKTDLERCIDSIFESTYENYEIIIADNGSTDEELFAYYEELKTKSNIKITYIDIPFNYSRINNEAVKIATGEYYILLNNDVQIITVGWIEEMLMYAQREDVGAVGAMLYYDDDTVQHAGVIMKLGAQRIAGHAFYKVPKQTVGYMGRLCYAQDMSAVTAACMMVKASVYEEVGGLDEKLCVAYNDIDFCMKIRQNGHLIVWTPHAEAYHFESKTRGYENDSPEKIARFNKEVEYFKEKWGSVLDKDDPYYNPNFSLDTPNFDLK